MLKYRVEGYELQILPILDYSHKHMNTTTIEVYLLEFAAVAVALTEVKEGGGSKETWNTQWFQM
jgi:hypothetical protein